MKSSRTPIWSGVAFAASLLLVAGAAAASTITVPAGFGGGTCGAGNANRYEFGGNCGSLVSITDTNAAYVQDNSPASEGTYRVRFYANFDGKSSVAPPAAAPTVDLTMAGGNAFDFFVAYDGADVPPPGAGGNAIIRAELSQSGADRVITFYARLNSGTASFSHTLTGKALRGWRAIEINWAKATTAGGTDGVLQAWVDGTSVGNLTNLANGNQVVNMVRWGAVDGLDAGTSGTFKIDDFVSQRTGYIGPTVMFSDVPQSGWSFPFVLSNMANELIPACGSGTFCPFTPVIRTDMAMYMLKAYEGTDYVPPACTTAPFDDVPVSHPYCPWINELKNRGVVNGCTATSYCPTYPVDREQMVKFILSTANPGVTPPACTTQPFTDIEIGRWSCPWVTMAFSTGLTNGCTATEFCPVYPTDKEQESKFTTIGFGLPQHVVGP
ncbi:MAG: S-layer homology domain-containing protein [Thermoanaerobaculia bacterium]|nr:S-layer homology domain-containing protein [Thermoanaerobaculia bacterium]